MKKIISFFITVILVISMSLPVFTSNNWVNLKLEYDGKVNKYSSGKINIKINNKIMSNFDIEPIILDGRTLVPLRNVFEEMGAKVYWDNLKKEASIKKDNNNIIFKINNIIAIKNENQTFNLNVPPKIINGYTMIPIRAISALDYDVKWDNSTRTVFINEKNNFTDETIKDSSIITEDNLQNISSKNQKQNSIKIVWDQTYPSINDKEIKRKPINGLTVLSPTWFDIKNSNGDVEDKGSLEYAKWAKEQGYQIWGLVTNSFDPIITHDTLSDYNKRKKIIDQLLKYAKKYNLDGINIDFESVSKNDGNYYLQFIKEATNIFKANKLTVSVDMYVPAPWTSHYNMKEVAKIVDYVIIMAYDEHHSNSTKSGSVASIPWVDKYMLEASKLVPKDKLIMGVPFYTRVWSEIKQKDGSIKITSKSLKMEEAKELLEKNKAEIKWLDETKQYYGEYIENGVTNKIWLEDERSIEERMKISRKYDVKGIAAWKRGHENDKTWDVINSYYN